MSKHFCCCIPVRAAVFFFSLLSLLSSGVVAASAWFVLYGAFFLPLQGTKTNATVPSLEIQHGKTLGDVDFSQISSAGKIAFIVAGSVFTLIALISLFGYVIGSSCIIPGNGLIELVCFSAVSLVPSWGTADLLRRIHTSHGSSSSSHLLHPVSISMPSSLARTSSRAASSPMPTVWHAIALSISHWVRRLVLSSSQSSSCSFTGTQYRSAIYYYNNEQKQLAEERFKTVNEQLQQSLFRRVLGSKVVTDLEPGTDYYIAEKVPL